MNEWITVYAYSHRYVWTYWEEVTLKSNAYNEIYLVTIWMFNDNLDIWQISLVTDRYYPNYDYTTLCCPLE